MVEEPGHGPEDDGSDEPSAASSPAPGQRGTRAAVMRLAERYVAIRATTIALDHGPGPVVRVAARMPALVTVALAVVLGTVFAVIFGVPPVSPLFLVALLCAPVYPWLRLEARAIERWRSDQSPPGS